MSFCISSKLFVSPLPKLSSCKNRQKVQEKRKPKVHCWPIFCNKQGSLSQKSLFLGMVETKSKEKKAPSPIESVSENNRILDPRQTMEEAIQKKKAVEAELMAMEKQIYKFEESYLRETALYGNVVKGWERYLTLKNASQSDIAKYRKFTDSDRLFSQSSVTSHLAVSGEGYKDHLNQFATKLSKNAKKREIETKKNTQSKKVKKSVKK